MVEERAAGVLRGIRKGTGFKPFSRAQSMAIW
jgi:hypothetical protein